MLAPLLRAVGEECRISHAPQAARRLQGEACGYRQIWLDAELMALARRQRMGTAPCRKTRPTEMSFSRDSKTNVHARTAGRYRYAIPGDETPRDLLYDVVLTVYKLFSVNDATINAGTVTDSSATPR